MPRKPVKPQTNLKLDILLFLSLLVITITAIVLRTTGLDSHAVLMLERLHGWAGIIMVLMISLHLLAHQPWIKSQLARLFGKR